ncbi:amino acid permease [Mycoplasma parvum]|uniref:Amino acid permease n=1 Tax=Mycoplasma parvum str. Indiana TaxID=1403316 RepID=U5NCL2_9MOLU|nr:amino acid permease [Mycoplasma parvum]AGX89065.1 hypothetical protein PRV_01540 [Mycoplasma parvum str. Indiana]
MSQAYFFKEEKNLLGKKQLFILSLSSMIGIGVFIKSRNLNELANFEFLPIIFLFLFAAIIISAMIFLFIKLIQNSSTTGRSFIEWVEKYCGKDFVAWSVRFTKDFALPIGIITTSIYLLKWIAGTNFLWVWEISALSLVIAALIMSLNVFSFKISEKFQRTLFIFIIFSLLFVAIMGLISIFQETNSNPKISRNNENKLEGLNSLSSWTILLSGLPAIFFMYDGFYSVLSLKEQAKLKTSFTKIILYSLYTITAIYLLIISITLLGDKEKGYFLNFQIFKDKNWKDVLTILIFLTFASSLNIACMCSQQQLLQLHYKYDFSDLHWIRKRLLNRGKNLMNFHFECKLSGLFHLIKNMFICVFLMSLITQLNYWISPSSAGSIFWDLNDMLAEQISLFIFVILGAVIWKSRNQNNFRFYKLLHYLVSFSIFGAILYYFLNTLIEFAWNTTFSSFMKIVLFLVMIIIPAIPYLKTILFRNRSEGRIIRFKRENQLLNNTFSQ